MAGAWESEAVQNIGKQYAELAAAGAPEDVLNNLHQRAEALRAKEGYSGGADGSKVISVGQLGGRENDRNETSTVIGSEDDFDSSSYDFKPTPISGESGSLDGVAIAGYVITALVIVVVLDKILG